MKTKPGFNIRNVCGENILVAEGKENMDFSNIISMNESSAFLWNEVQGSEFTIEDMAKILTDNYQIDDNTPLPMATALADAMLWPDNGGNVALSTTDRNEAHLHALLKAGHVVGVNTLQCYRSHLTYGELNHLFSTSSGGALRPCSTHCAKC